MTFIAAICSETIIINCSKPLPHDRGYNHEEGQHYLNHDELQYAAILVIVMVVALVLMVLIGIHPLMLRRWWQDRTLNGLAVEYRGDPPVPSPDEAPPRYSDIFRRSGRLSLLRDRAKSANFDQTGHINLPRAFKTISLAGVHLADPQSRFKV